MSSSSSTFVHRETYRGFAFEVVRTDRTGSPLMDTEFLVFIGGDLTIDEIETLEQAIVAARKLIDACRTAI